ncbi:hypothetical protein Tco_0941646, partial [Tanacetum coccineum]
PPHQPPPPPPPAGSSGTPGASGSSQLPPPPPPPPPLSTHQSDQSTSTAAPSSSKTAASAEYTAWTTTDTRLKPSVSSIPEDLHMADDTALDEQVHSSDRPATPEPAWSIPSSDLPVPINNWVSAHASTYAPTPENSLLAQTSDMVIFIDWFCKKQGITELKQDLEGPAYEIVKVFHPNVIHLQYQIEECHKLLIDQVDESIIRYNVNKPLPLGGPPGQVTIQSDFFFNKDLEYLRYGSKSGRPALSISKMKAAYYPDVELEQMVPDQMWIEEECKYYIAAMYGMGEKIVELEKALAKRTQENSDLSMKIDNLEYAFAFELKRATTERMTRLPYNFAKIPKLYRASELCDKNEQLHVFNSEETFEDVEKSQLKMNKFQKDEKVQELKIQPIDYEKLNKLYKDFVPQKELSAEQTYFSSSSIPCVKDSVKILETKSMPSESPLIKELYNIKVGFEKLSLLIKQNSKRASIFYTSPAEIERIEFCQKQVKPILNELQTQQKGCACCESVKTKQSWPSIFLGTCLDHLYRRNELGELWDCQLGNLTAGKV